MNIETKNTLDVTEKGLNLVYGPGVVGFKLVFSGHETVVSMTPAEMCEFCIAAIQLSGQAVLTQPPEDRNSFKIVKP